MKNNITKTNYGYDIIWHSAEDYGAKIIVFESPSKTDFILNKESKKTWFVNSGEFLYKWIDTTDGKIYQKELAEGTVASNELFVPYALECTSKNGSLSETNNGEKLNDKCIILNKDLF